jgi:hypothetical protein
MVMSIVGDDHYFSTALKIHFYTGIVIFLGHRPKPLRFFTVYGQKEVKHNESEDPVCTDFTVQKLKRGNLIWACFICMRRII